MKNNFHLTRGEWAAVFMLVLFCVVCVAFQQFAYWQKTHWINGTDYDAILRILSVEQLMNSGDWFDHIYPRINPPAGMVVHWTRAMDLILVPGGYALNHFFPLRAALLFWSMILSPVSWFLFILVMLWATRPLALRDAEKLILIFLCIMTNSVSSTFYLSRAADYHAVVMICQMLALGSVLRAEGNCKWAFFAGLFCGMGIWFAAEGFALFVLIAAGYGILWLLHGNKIVLKNLCFFCAGAFLVTFPALLAEYPFGELLSVYYDRLSIAYVVPIALTGLVGAVLAGVNFFLTSRLRRGLCGFLCAAFVLVVLESLFPHFHKGPLNDVPEFLQRTWLPQIGEMHGASKLAIFNFPSFLLRSVVALTALILLVTGKKKDSLIIWLACFAGFFLLSEEAGRWMRFSDVIALPFVAIALFYLISVVSDFTLSVWSHVKTGKKIDFGKMIPGLLLRKEGHNDKTNSNAASLIQVFVAIGLLLCIYSNTLGFYSLDRKERSKQECGMALLELVQKADWDALLGTETQTIAANTDHGIPLLFWTKNNILTANYHRNEGGFRKLYNIFFALDENNMKQVVEDSRVSSFLLCPEDVAGLRLDPETDEKEKPLRAEMHKIFFRKELPGWLEKIEWPESAGEILKKTKEDNRPVLLRVKKFP